LPENSLPRCFIAESIAWRTSAPLSTDHSAGTSGVKPLAPTRSQTAVSLTDDLPVTGICNNICYDLGKTLCRAKCGINIDFLAGTRCLNSVLDE
jgi:hypothetical protein